MNPRRGLGLLASGEVDSMSYDARMLVTFNVLRSLGHGFQVILSRPLQPGTWRARCGPKALCGG